MINLISGIAILVSAVSVVKIIMEIEISILWLHARICLLTSVTCSCCKRRRDIFINKWENQFLNNLWRQNPSELSLPQGFKLLDILAKRRQGTPLGQIANTYIRNLKAAAKVQLNPSRARIDVMTDEDLHILLQGGNANVHRIDWSVPRFSVRRG